MARTRLTARKSTCGYLPARVREFPLEARNPDAYRQWQERRREEENRRMQAQLDEIRQQHAAAQLDEIQRQHAAMNLQVEEDDQQEDSEEEPEEVELMQTDEQPEQGEQEDQQGQDDQQDGGQVAGDAPGGDPGDDDDDGDDDGDDDAGDDDDDEDEDDDGPATPPAPAQPPPPRTPEGWTVVTCTRDGGDCFFHPRLLDLLRSQFGWGNVGVEYQSELWTHPRYRHFWKTEVQVRVSSSSLRAAREQTRHYAITARDSQEAGIADAARQAYYVYRDMFFSRIRADHKDKWYPRRRSGEAGCRIASTTGVTDPQLVSTVALVANLSTELDGVLDENYRLRADNQALQDRIAELEASQGHPAPRPTEYLGDSPPRKRARYRESSSRTTVDP